MTFESLTKQEVSLLLFLECRAVDYAGAIPSGKLNAEEIGLAQRWHADGFIQFGRIYSGDRTHGSYWCVLSPEAWSLVAKARQKLAQTKLEQRTWMRTEEAGF